MLANPFFRISSFLECDLKTGSQNITCSFNITCSPRSCGICWPTPEANHKAFEDNNDDDFVLRSLCWLFSLSTQFPPDQVAQPCQVQTSEFTCLKRNLWSPRSFLGIPAFILSTHFLRVTLTGLGLSTYYSLSRALLLHPEKPNVKLPST